MQEVPGPSAVDDLARGLSQGGDRGRSITRADAVLLCQASLVFVGTANPQGQLDAATCSGDPGFIREVARNTFEVPDFAGNAMSQTIGNLLLEPRTSIGFIAGGDFVVLTGSSTTPGTPPSSIDPLPLTPAPLGGIRVSAAHDLIDMRQPPSPGPVWELCEFYILGFDVGALQSVGGHPLDELHRRV
ncbi:pyridoxamine 5'-phosphate oxidase family protein [Streptomyces sp. NPDC001601]|uniref:pyridoxamine 5'-phosphate oxidase family protein n=1 Tax=Streptomyces sp. NPDC001601 TaxID=3364592 RepID=UPI0036B13D71